MLGAGEVREKALVIRCCKSLRYNGRKPTWKSSEISRHNHRLKFLSGCNDADDRAQDFDLFTDPESQERRSGSSWPALRRLPAASQGSIDGPHGRAPEARGR